METHADDKTPGTSNAFSILDWPSPEVLMAARRARAHAVRDMARQGTELLFEKIGWPADEPWTPRRVAYEPRLVVRESSRAASPPRAMVSQERAWPP